MDSTACLRPVGAAPQQSHFVAAAQAAESSGARQITGRAFPCSRGGGRVTPAQCLEKFRSGDRPCVSPEHGRCTTGIIEDAKHSEDDMGKSNYGKCVLCGRTANRDSEGRCYLAGCVAKRKAPVDPLEMRDCPEDGRKSVGSLEEVKGSDGTVMAMVPSGASGRLREVLADPGTICLTDDHISQPGKMVPTEAAAADDGPDLPEDLDQPFTLAGIEFAPLRHRRVTGENAVSIRKSTIGISRRAEELLSLSGFTHARYTVSLDGQAVAIKFLSARRPDAITVQRTNGGMSISSAPLARQFPHLVGRRAELETTEIPGWYVVRFGHGEAA